MFRTCVLVSFTTLLVLLSFCENYGYLKKVYLEFYNQTAADVRLTPEGSAESWTMESIERLAMAFVVCATSIFFWRDFNHYRILFGKDAKEEITKKLVRIKNEIESRLKILEDKIDDLYMRHTLGYTKRMSLLSVDKQKVVLEAANIEMEMEDFELLQPSTDVETIYSRPAGRSDQQQFSDTLTLDACHHTESEGLGVEKGNQTSCPRINTEESGQQTPVEDETDSPRSVFSVPATRVGTGDVPAREAASWYEEVQKEEEILKSSQVQEINDETLEYKIDMESVLGTEGGNVSPGREEFDDFESLMNKSNYRRIPRYQGAKKGYAKQYHSNVKQSVVEQYSPTYTGSKSPEVTGDAARLSRPATPRHYPPEGTEPGLGAPNRRRKQRNYNPK